VRFLVFAHTFFLVAVGNKLAFNAAKSAAALAAPAAILTTSIPAQASTSIIDAIPTESLALEVQFGAYLAVLLGEFCSPEFSVRGCVFSFCLPSLQPLYPPLLLSSTYC